VKLMLVGVIPMLFLLYLSGQLYKEKRQKVKLINGYIEHIHEANKIAVLINELETERKYSFEYALKKDGYGKIILQRSHTDGAIENLKRSNDPTIANFQQYTFLNDLPKIRHMLDTTTGFPTEVILQFYTRSILRLNTLNQNAASSSIYLQPVYQDMIAQRTLFEMVTYMGIMSTDIYNLLYTGQNFEESLISLKEYYNVYNSYETEFLLKASPASVKLYNEQKNTTALKPTLQYIKQLVVTSQLDSSYTAENWWTLSSEAKDVLKKQQSDLWSKVESGMNNIYLAEKRSQNVTLILLLVAIVLVVFIVGYSLRIINQILQDLKIASVKISKGASGITFKNMPNDVMGTLAKSVLEIDKNNLQLARAASAIGSGNFDVEVSPRSEEDLLGNSMVKMKEDLQKFTSEKDKLQKETLELVKRKDDFLSIASHELKTPVTSLKAYTQLLHLYSENDTAENRKLMLSRMDNQIDKLTSLINDLLDTSKIQQGILAYNKGIFQLDELVKEVIDEIQTATPAQKIEIENLTPVQIFGDRERISQVLVNLVNNAVKYCPDTEKILINLKCNGPMAICSVQDFGAGIFPEHQNKIFDRFYRITDNDQNTFPGLGLGLYIAREIIERHYGKIWVESEPGKGSTFFFGLPVANYKKS
jgi:signal transduction histidine kinase